MEFYMQLLIASLPTLIVVGFMFLIVKRYVERDEKHRFFQLKRENQKEILELRLQAYERLIMLLERSELESLKRRIYKMNMKADIFVFSAIKSIDAELEHNITQQVYLSDAAWAGAKKALEDQKDLFLTSLGELKDEPEDCGLFFDFYRKNADEIIHTSIKEALILVKSEVRKLF